MSTVLCLDVHDEDDQQESDAMIRNVIMALVLVAIGSGGSAAVAAVDRRPFASAPETVSGDRISPDFANTVERQLRSLNMVVIQRKCERVFATPARSARCFEANLEGATRRD